MTTGYSQTPKLLKGALIYFGAPMLIPIPNIIVFQYNPETMSRTLAPWEPPESAMSIDAAGNATRSDLNARKRYSLSQPYDPVETFSLSLELDATDALEHPDTHPVAALSGVADRVAAIEMLMYPPGDSVLGGLMGSISASVSLGSDGPSASVGGKADSTPKMENRSVPIVLFFWGPGRIVPVRITSLQVDELQYSPTLYPLRATANLGIRVLSMDDLQTIPGDPANSATLDIAKACYKFTRAQKEVLAMANLANSVESIVGMLPI